MEHLEFMAPGVDPIKVLGIRNPEAADHPYTPRQACKRLKVEGSPVQEDQSLLEWAVSQITTGSYSGSPNRPCQEGAPVAIEREMLDYYRQIILAREDRRNQECLCLYLKQVKDLEEELNQFLAELRHEYLKKKDAIIASKGEAAINGESKPTRGGSESEEKTLEADYIAKKELAESRVKFVTNQLLTQYTEEQKRNREDRRVELRLLENGILIPEENGEGITL